METSETTSLFEKKPNSEECKLYVQRWFVLAIFVSIAFSNLAQSMEFISITETVVKYYNNSVEDVNWTALIFMLLVSFLSFFSTYFIEIVGIRKAVLLSALGTSTGAWIKLAGIMPNRFWVIMLGQSIVGGFESLLIPILPKLAAAWFGANEISTACSLGIISIPISNAMGFILPTLMVDPTNFYTIQDGLYGISIVYAVFPTVLTIIAFFYFSEKPPTPPTIVKLQNESIQKYDHFKSLKNIITNSSFVFLFLGYSINVGFFNTLSTMLNPLIIANYPHATVEVGITGLIMNFVGIFGSITTGVLLDRYKRYRSTTWVIALLYLGTSVAFSFLIGLGINLVYCLAGLYGFCLGAFLPIGIELGIELTYPESESTIGCIVLIGPQLLAIGFTSLYTYVFQKYNELVTNFLTCGILILGDVFLALIKFNLKRTAALNNDSVI